MHSLITAIVILSGVLKRWAYPSSLVTPAISVTMEDINSVVSIQTDEKCTKYSPQKDEKAYSVSYKTFFF